MDLDVFPSVADPDRLVGLVISSHGLALSLRDHRPFIDPFAIRTTQFEQLAEVLP
jgi:hypothetical protein